MGILSALTFGLVVWITAWALGIKAFDAFLATLAIVLVAVTVKVSRPFIDRLVGNE